MSSFFSTRWTHTENRNHNKVFVCFSSELMVLVRNGLMETHMLTVYVSAGFCQHLQELLGLWLGGFGRHQCEPRGL